MPDKSKILMIDDEEDICFFTKSVLEGTGKYEVIVSLKAKEGIELAKSHKPDLILLDVLMPEMDGSKVAECLYEDESTKAIPIVFLSAVAAPMALFTTLLENENLNQRSEKKSRHYFIQKPITAQELLDRLESILKEGA